TQKTRDAISKKLNVKMIKTSAKENTNVEEAFREMTKEILARARDKSK
ncbi:unnamed protein product, partial [marine sediment metagenome]